MPRRRCTTNSDRCRSSARMATSIRECWPSTSPFPNPAALIVIPDHYIVRMLYSQGVPMESLGIPRLDGGAVERDPRAIWQRFADHFYLFRGTPSGAWLAHEFEGVFGIDEPLTSATAMRIYDRIDASLRRPEFRPAGTVRALQDRGALHDRCGHRHARVPSADSGLRLERRSSARRSGRTWPSTSCTRSSRRRSVGCRRPPASDVTIVRGLRPRAREPARVLQVDGRDGYRPRGRDAVHG